MTSKEFRQATWDDETIDDCRQLIRLAVREDLSRGLDLTTVALVSQQAEGAARVVFREPGVVAGLPAAELVLQEMNANVRWQTFVAEGAAIGAGDAVAEVSGSTRDLLTCERLLLNLVGRLSGIATRTREYVTAVAATGTRIYDTRKTTPGWRRLEKYAVRCGGGCNHRTGLFDAILIKDNHLAQGNASVAEALARAREFLAMQEDESLIAETILEVEVDTLDQLDEALQQRPDIVLLDNMNIDQLREAVQKRNTASKAVQLEASGGITLDTIQAVAATGVDRISVGAITHSATALDIALDWCG